MNYFELQHQGATYRIHCRTPRKSNRRLRLSVDNTGTIFLSHPLQASRTEIRNFARSHLDWMARRAASEESRAARPEPYAHGSTHWLWGQACTLVLQGTAKHIEYCNGQLITAPADKSELIRRFNILHRQCSESRIPALVAEQNAHCPWVDVLPPIRYRAMRNTWGTCRSDGLLTFNTRLVQYPVPLIEHVIIHELCHLAEHNHSPAFYALMSRAQPDWQQRKAALTAFSRQLPAT